MNTKKDLLSSVQQKFGVYSVNDFTKKVYDLALKHQDFFFDVITGVIETSYSDSDVVK